jgi:hypothetical protein
MRNTRSNARVSTFADLDWDLDSILGLARDVTKRYFDWLCKVNASSNVFNVETILVWEWYSVLKGYLELN